MSAENLTGEINPITQEGAEASLGQVARVLTSLGGLEQLHALTEIAGGTESYAALIASSETFIKQNPGICEGRIPAPYVMGLWIGLLAGAHAAETR